MTLKTVPRIALSLAWLLLLVPAGGIAQTSPANVVTPTPPAREGTVGPEQLRDFALPGTRRPEPQDAAPAPAPPPAPAPEREATEPSRTPSAARPPVGETVPRRLDSVTLPAPSPAAQPVPQGTVAAPPAQAETAPAEQVTVGLGAPIRSASPGFADPLPPSALPATDLPALDATDADPPLPWWPWALAAALAGLALALLWRRRSRAEPLGADFTKLATAQAGPPPVAPAPRPDPVPAAPLNRQAAPPPAAPTPPAALPPAPAPRPAAEDANFPSGLVTTRLRPRPSAPPAAPGPAARPDPAPLPVGAIVSRGLRPRIDLDVAVEEVLISEADALIRFRLAISNLGSTAARDIVVEALALNAGETQAGELAAFYARPAESDRGIAMLERMGITELRHEVTMPRAAIRAYEVQGRQVFVPIIAFNATYRWSSGEARTSAAFLVGHERPGSERLAPLQLHAGSARLSQLGVRMLDEFVAT